MDTRTLKSCTSAFALFAMGAAQASIVLTDQSGGSEVLLNLVNTVDSSSYTLDLGVKFADLNDGDVFPLDGGASAFISGAGIGNVRFAIIAGDVNARQFVTTSADPNFLSATVGNALRGTWTNSIDELILNINSGDASAGSVNNGYGPIASGPSPNYVGGGHDLWQGSVDNMGAASEPISIYVVTFGTSLLGSASKALLVAQPATLSATDLTIGSGGGNGGITGTSGDDILTGTADADVLYGLAGNDTINGLGGDDTMYGGTGDDILFVNSAGDEVIELSGEGTDVIRSSASYTLPANVENLTLLGTGNIDATGNSQDNTLTGNSGTNRLDGKAGADTLKGLDGNDTYVVDNVGDVVIETAGQGADTVLSSTVSVVLAKNVERLTLQGSASINATGNTLKNVIKGNSGANTINGWFKSDTLTGGGGPDRFLFNSAPGSANQDTITDFALGEDQIRLENSIFTGLTSTGTLAANAFRIGNQATTPEHRIIYVSGTGKLFYDADGNGPTSQVPFAIVTPGLALTNASFFVQ